MKNSCEMKILSLTTIPIGYAQTYTDEIHGILFKRGKKWWAPDFPPW